MKVGTNEYLLSKGGKKKRKLTKRFLGDLYNKSVYFGRSRRKQIHQA